jgi:flagellar hook-basal body complex protein FliE
MSIFRPELKYLDTQSYLPIRITHEKHMVSKPGDFLNLGKKITETEEKIGADAVIRSGTFTEVMLGALDKVSAYQQFASNMNQTALTDPDSVNPEDVTIAQAMANTSLNITRNVLSRMVQSWRDVINTR